MTLEQLIEACGDNLSAIVAKSHKKQWSAVSYSDTSAIVQTYGSTPTEAVQKLYDYLKENNLI